MTAYLVRRVLWTIPTLFVVSFVSFMIIQLPPGDYVTAYAAELRHSGEYLTDAQEEAIRTKLGLNDPYLMQYWRWISNIVLRGDFGQSFHWNAPVSDLIWDRLALTLLLSTLSLLMTWAIAIPIGVYSATRQYSIGDYTFTIFGFLGKGSPDCLLALVLSWLMRMQIGFPGSLEFIDPEAYYQYVTMHGMIMVIYLLTALLLGGFGLKLLLGK